MTALVLSALILLGPQDALAAGREWRQVQALRPGDPIKVVMKAGVVEGKFVAANDDLLVIQLRKGNFTLDRASIKRLDQRLAGSNRGRNIVCGFAAGLGAGLVRGAFDTGENDLGRTMLTMPFMLVGTVVGATAPATRWETVYRKEDGG